MRYINPRFTYLLTYFQMKGAEYERLANSVFVLGIVSSGSAVDRVWRVASHMLDEVLAEIARSTCHYNVIETQQ